MHAAIGHDLEASEDDTILVWEAIASLKKGLQTVTGNAEANLDFLTQARNSLRDLVTNLDKLTAHYRENMPRINKVLLSSKLRLTKLEANPKTASRGSSGFQLCVDDEPPDTDMDITALRAKFDSTVADLRTEISQQAAGNATGGTRPDLDTVVDEFAGQISELEARTSGQGFASGDHVFNSKPNVLEYLVAEKVPNEGCFWDLFSVLASMSPKRQKGKDKADESYSAKRINSTQLDNDLLSAMMHERPDVLYARKVGGKIGSLEDGFVACPSYKQWITGTDSYKSKLTKELCQFCTGVEGAIPKGTSYKALATSLLSNVRNQWSTLCSFIDSFYVELTGVANFPKEKAWKLTGRFVAAVFTTMGPHRANVSLFDDLGPLEHKGACMWGVMQCHRIVTKFERVDYRGHPGVVTEMNLFLLMERVDPALLACNDDKIKWLEGESKLVKCYFRSKFSCLGLVPVGTY
jgi:hypothetical protein